MNQSPGWRRGWIPGNAGDRLPEIPRERNAQPPPGPSLRCLPGRVWDGSEESVEPFDAEEMTKLLRMDAARSPALAHYWRDGSNDDLGADPRQGFEQARRPIDLPRRLLLAPGPGGTQAQTRRGQQVRLPPAQSGKTCVLATLTRRPARLAGDSQLCVVRARSEGVRPEI